ncbi:MAG: pgmB [Clostridia bacterium]|jgi:beta-phosphoglucomutase|nr:pgmB [Clostridia bacterium]
MSGKYKAAIFDLDGVLVDTAKYHFLAWKELAESLNFEFTQKDNELLKGVSRMESLNILLHLGGLAFSDEEKEKIAREKNERYVEYISKIDESDLLPGTVALLEELQYREIKTAIGSASKNTPLIIERLGIKKYFGAISDGNIIKRAKPDPEVFIKAASMLSVLPGDCVVFEDARAGIQAAKNAGMYAVGVGKKEDLPGADEWIASLGELNTDKLF